MKKFKYIGADKFLKSHLIKVIEKGEYEVGDVRFDHNPTVLDLGANIGSYTYYIVNKYPGAHVIAFEPIPATVENYLENMKAVMMPAWNYRLMPCAVFPTDDKTLTMYLSKVNSGMNSFQKVLTNTAVAAKIQVPVVRPKYLPNCDILKMDIEGAEVPVLKEYLTTHPKPAVVSFEFHYFADRCELEEILGDEYILVSGRITSPSMGTLNFVHKDAFDRVA